MRQIGEDTRRAVTRATAWGAWLLAAGFTTLRVTEVLDQTAGVLIVMLIGFAIAAGSALSRMHLRDTIVGAFKVGMESAEERIADERQVATTMSEESSQEILLQIRANRDAIQEMQRKLDAQGYSEVSR